MIIDLFIKKFLFFKLKLNLFFLFLPKYRMDNIKVFLELDGYYTFAESSIYVDNKFG
jgi:hypothetical protein